MINLYVSKDNLKIKLLIKVITPTSQEKLDITEKYADKNWKWDFMIQVSPENYFYISNGFWDSLLRR